MWAIIEDIESRWPKSESPLPDSEDYDEHLAVLIEDAEDTIVREFPDVPARLEAGTLPLKRVKKVVTRMVIRHLLNPTGMRSVSGGAGPYQQTVTYGGEDPGALYLSDEDRKDLSSGRSRAFMIDTTPAYYKPAPPDVWHEVWWSD